MRTRKEIEENEMQHWDLTPENRHCGMNRLFLETLLDIRELLSPKDGRCPDCGYKPGERGNQKDPE